MGKGKGSGGVRTSKKKDDDFDQFLKDLSQATETSGKTKKKSQPTHDERRTMLLQKQDEERQIRAREMEGVFEQQQRQKQIRAMLDEMMANQSPFGQEPVKNFQSEEKSSSKYEACTGWMQGWRNHMEDAHVVAPEFQAEGNNGLFAVFDGHGGAKCSELCRAVFPVLANKHYKDDQTIDFAAMYHELDATLKVKLQEQSGTTAVAVLINEKTVTCANVGDSRAVLSRKGGKAVSLSEDHKPENPEEMARIEAGGGHVADNRVNGQLAMSRALGDFQYKGNSNFGVDEQLVIPDPEIMSADREEGDEFLVVACDGIFDVLSNEDLVTIISNKLKTDISLPDLCQEICMLCLAPGSEGRPTRAAGTDNMTITIVRLL